MKLIGAGILLVLSFSTALAQQPAAAAAEPKCNCLTTPIEPSPPCLDRCCTKVLITSTLEELKLILGVREELARRIVEWEGRNDAKTLKDFEKILKPEEIVALSDRVNSLSKPQLEYLNQTPQQRIEITTEMKALFERMGRGVERP